MDVQEPARRNEQRWRSAVAGVLAKSTRRDPADLPPEPERLLDSPTYEGFPIRALYTSLDALPEPPLPGDWPFVRGGDALRDVKSGWKVAEAFPVAGQKAVTDGNGAVLVALTEGVSALVLRVGAPDGVAPADLDRLLEGVFLDLVPVVLDAGSEFLAAAEAVLPLLADMDDDQRARLSIDLGADPLTAPLSERSAPNIADVVATAAKVTSYAGGVRAITVDGPALHNLGASASWELAGAVAAGVGYLRLLGDAGLSVPDSLRQISFRLAADDDQFMTIAKFRVMRRLWARVAEVVGEPDAGAARVHAVTSMPMMAQRDPWVNMLRTTVAAFGAGVGGADTVLVQPFDAAIPGGLPGTAAGFARRIARNTQLLLLEESHLGRVLDPAGGSWFVEDLTEQLAEQAWEHFQQIEAHGGFAEARDFVATQIAEVRDRRTDDIAHRRTALTGVNEYPNLDESPLPHRDSSAHGASDTPPGSRRCATAPMLTWRRPGRGRRCCCCRSVRSPSTTSAPRSPPTCSPPAASRRSIRVPSRPRVWPTRFRPQAPGCRGALRDRRPVRNRSGGCGRRRAQGRGVARPAGRTGKGGRRRRSQARRLPDRQDRRGRRPVGPAHSIGGMTR